MRVLNVRNVHQALPMGIHLLDMHGQTRDSRNGPVRMTICPVTTVYEKPCERVIFWPERDANPFFHLYESLWMLNGRNDIAPLCRYVPNMLFYSDDGVTQHGAYGWRWREHFQTYGPDRQPFRGQDQLKPIAARLRKNPDDRRCVLQMWDCEVDLGFDLKDVPCNTIATFQRDIFGSLDLTVFCRSNDIIWGAYGANAVHFTMLQEYMAQWIGCDVGKFYQISVNYHAYNKTLEPIKDLGNKSGIETQVVFSSTDHGNPYTEHDVKHIPMPTTREGESNDNWADRMDATIHELLNSADNGFPSMSAIGLNQEIAQEPWVKMVYCVLFAHHIYKTEKNPTKAISAMNAVAHLRADWVVAATEWLERRVK